ncbi:MAG: DUF5711 family protein, partial [Oscillospiraceae bacterium]|nr:DUF5711 family protein [Oscillospiraceae bacterium]
TNQSRALSFDPGSRAYRIHTPARTDYHEPENGIISAALADNNMFALVTSARQFVAEAAVYRSPTEEPVFRWLSPDNHITGVALSPRGTHMAVACVMTEGGMLKSQAVLFQLDSTDMVEIGFPGSLILQLEYTDARLCILTDREYAVFDYSGESLFSYDLGSDPVSAIRSYDGETLLLTEYREARTSRLVLLDESLTVTAQHSAPNNIKGIEIGRRRIYVLDDSGIEAFDRQLNSMEKTERRGITHMQLVDGKLYYTTADEIFLFD